MAYKDLKKKAARSERRNARRRELNRLRSGEKVDGKRKLFNPGPWKHKVPEEQAPPPAPRPLSWIDRAQVAAYGYAGALKPNFL